jgi:hypothetical protein
LKIGKEDFGKFFSICVPGKNPDKNNGGAGLGAPAAP